MSQNYKKVGVLKPSYERKSTLIYYIYQLITQFEIGKISFFNSAPRYKDAWGSAGKALHIFLKSAIQVGCQFYTQDTLAPCK